MQIVVRRVSVDDVEPIVELMNSVIRTGTYSIMDDEIAIDEQLEFIRDFPERGMYNAAFGDDGRLLGLQDVMPFASTSNAFAHVGEISTFVALDILRRGVGRALMDATIAAVRTLGYGKICANIRADNPRAIAFYCSQGFELIGTAREHAFVRGRYIDQILTERLLE